MPVSKSYTIPCSSRFRDAVTGLAQQRHVSVADLARAVLLLLPMDTLAALPDPGEPTLTDREDVTLKSGPTKDRRIRRKPRLQARLQPGLRIADLRRALAAALDLGHGTVSVRLEDARAVRPPTISTVDDNVERQALVESWEEVGRLRQLLQSVSFQPLDGGIATRSDALYVLGYPPSARPDARALKSRFRLLAQIHHPDSPTGNTLRMSQLNAAIQHLLRG
jgi:hypothetical protein